MDQEQEDPVNGRLVTPSRNTDIQTSPGEKVYRTNHESQVEYKLVKTSQPIAEIERLGQWTVTCLKQRTSERYQQWEKYTRLMEHVWNTAYHSTKKHTPQYSGELNTVRLPWHILNICPVASRVKQT